MKKEKEKETGEEDGAKVKVINRKQALKKVGYIALSAATMMILIGVPKQAMASPASLPAWPS